MARVNGVSVTLEGQQWAVQDVVESSQRGEFLSVWGPTLFHVEDLSFDPALQLPPSFTKFRKQAGAHPLPQDHTALYEAFCCYQTIASIVADRYRNRCHHPFKRHILQFLARPGNRSHD